MASERTTDAQTRAGDTVEADDRAEELERRARTYRHDAPSTAPAAVPDAALRLWVSGPLANDFYRRGLTDAPMPTRTALITAGVSRRGPITPESQAARGLAALCRRPSEFWGFTVKLAVDQCNADGVAIPPEELVELAHDPLGFHDSGRYPPDVVLLAAVLIGLDDDVLEVLGASLEDPDEAAREARERKAEDRFEQLKTQNTELKTAVRDVGKKLKGVERNLVDARNEVARLEVEIERMRSANAAAGAETLAEEQRARQRAETALARLQSETESLKVEANRVADLEAERDALIASRDTLLAESRSVEQERQERAEVEVQVQQHLRTIADLRIQLREAGIHGSALPVEDGRALLRALMTPIGRAMRLASDRMASGETLANDAELVQVGAALMAAARTMNLSDGETVAPRPVHVEEATDPEAPQPAAAVEQPRTYGEIVSDGTQTEAVAGEAEPAVEVAAHGGAAVSVAPVAKRRLAPAFTIRPVGGAAEIGGSAILVETRSGRSVLLDAGQRVKDDYGPAAHNQFHHGVRGVEDLDAILVSHAHIDHVGSLPTLCRFFDEVPVLMSDPSRDLTEIMLFDSARIQHVKAGQPDLTAELDFAPGTMEPAYDEPAVHEALAHIQTVVPHTPMRLDAAGLIVRFIPVNHVLGSCAIHITDIESGQTLLYTGDLGPMEMPQLTLPPTSPETILHAQTIIMESTYGVLKDTQREGKHRSGLHGRDREVKTLFDCAEQAFVRGGHVLLPSFALGRTQELVELIGRHADSMPIYLAGMGQRIFDVYDKYKRKRGGEHGWVRPGVYPRVTSINKWVRNSTFEEVAVEVLDMDPGFIIAGPAMLSGGWSLNFLNEMVEDPRHAIIFSGYLPRYATTVGRLRHLGKGRPINLPSGRKTIQSDWLQVGLSAHANGVDLRNFAKVMASQAEHVDFGLVHGEPQAQEELAQDLNLIESAAATPLSNGATWEPQALS